MGRSDIEFKMQPGVYHFAEQAPFRPLGFRRAARKLGFKTETTSPRGAELLIRVWRPEVGIAIEFGAHGLPHFHVTRDGMVRDQPHPASLPTPAVEPVSNGTERDCWCGCDRRLSRAQRRAAEHALQVFANVACLEEYSARIGHLMPEPAQHAEFLEAGRAFQVELLAVAHGEWDRHYIDDGRLAVWQKSSDDILRVCVNLLAASEREHETA